jgi:hypothetical protein
LLSKPLVQLPKAVEDLKWELRSNNPNSIKVKEEEAIVIFLNNDYLQVGLRAIAIFAS